MNTMYSQIKVNVVSYSVFNFGCNFPPIDFLYIIFVRFWVSFSCGSKLSLSVLSKYIFTYFLHYLD
jgi:hypothetical protein